MKHIFHWLKLSIVVEHDFMGSLQDLCLFEEELYKYYVKIIVSVKDLKIQKFFL